jgi:hypothetical protein
MVLARLFRGTVEPAPDGRRGTLPEWAGRLAGRFDCAGRGGQRPRPTILVRIATFG